MIKPVLGSFCILAAAAAVATAAPSEAEAQGGNCFASFNNEISTLTRNKPMNPNWGMRDTFQWTYFIGEEGINILMKYQSCLSAADFASNFQALDGMRDKGRDGCLQTTTNAASCVARYPGE